MVKKKSINKKLVEMMEGIMEWELGWGGAWSVWGGVVSSCGAVN